MKYYVKALQQYAVFSGRATRSEFWYFALFNTLISFACVIVVASLAGVAHIEFQFQWVAYLYFIATLLPAIAVSVRRLHDIGMSGWWLLISLVPMAGIVLIVFYCLDSKPGANKYGPNPKGVQLPLQAEPAPGPTA